MRGGGGFGLGGSDEDGEKSAVGKRSPVTRALGYNVFPSSQAIPQCPLLLLPCCQ